MTYTDLTAKIKFFEKSPARLQEPHEGTTAWMYLWRLVENYFESQDSEVFETESWIQQTEDILSRMSRLMKEVEYEN